MGDIAIRAEGVGKAYAIGHQSGERESYTALRDVLGRSLKTLGRTAADMLAGRAVVAGDTVEEFWALRDVSFEIGRGEVVGIIGRNGAGKSTLLKVLSRITEPTTGQIEIHGRVASLLEVGTGFHPELTGRENIYLNGAILGMSRAEIRAKFEEIVAFAEVERFLDTPVKRFSSGMYVRLAFAVAAHLEPEILIVDEVLAVGDAEFQKKCLGKMQDVAGHGRTVLFVSHNMAAVQSLTSRALVLDRGSIAFAGPTSEAVRAYHAGLEGASTVNTWHAETSRRKAASVAAITDVRIWGEAAHTIPTSGGECHFSIGVLASRHVEKVRIAVGVDSPQGYRLFTLDTRKCATAFDLQPGSNAIQCTVDRLQLKSDDYRVHIYLGSDYETYDYEDGTILMRVDGRDLQAADATEAMHGPIVVDQRWGALSPS